jgi:hypothetical protein
MTWSYSGDPSTSSKDQVRFFVGDTDINNQLSSDEEIIWVLSVQSSIYLAAATVCESIGSKFNVSVDEKVGDLSRSGGKVTDNWLSRAKWLRNLAATNSLPFFGGRTISGKRALTQDTDAVQLSFSRGMDDAPGTPRDGRSEDYFRYGYR